MEIEEGADSLRAASFGIRSQSGLREHFNLLSRGEQSPVFRVVLTGGPCAGKTTAMTILEERMKTRGFRTFFVPEAATLLINGGAQFGDLTSEARVKQFQASLLKTQMALEDTFHDLAKMCGQPSIVICDRGIMDGSAYMTRSLWLDMLRENEWNDVQLRDRRYDAVLHLITAADGAKEFYTLQSNKARHETLEEAIVMDRKLRQAWVGHPRVRVIDNRTDFSEKMNRLVNAICNLVGLPQIPEVSRKFVVRGDFSRMLSGAGFLQEFDVDQTILESADADDDECHESVRRRGHHGVYSYVHRVRKKSFRGDYVEVKRTINEREYLTLLGHADPTRKTLRIRRRCFIYSDTYYVLDEIKNIDPPLILLRTQTEDEDTVLDLPRFIELEKEVTGDPAFKVDRLAKQVTPQRKFEYETLVTAYNWSFDAPTSL